MGNLSLCVSDDFKRRLKLRAARLGRSVAVHVRKILSEEMAGELVTLHHYDFTAQRAWRKREHKKKSPILWVPLTIQRGNLDWDVEVEVRDFYIRRHPRFSRRLCADTDDVNEVHLAPEALIEETGEKITLTESEISRAEAKFWKLLAQN